MRRLSPLILVLFLVAALSSFIFVANANIEETHELVINIEGEGEYHISGTYSTTEEENVYEVDDGEKIELYASPDEEWVFSGWEGDIESGEQEVSFTMNSDIEVTAVFKPVLEITYPNENETVKGRDIEVEWEVRTEDFTHIEIRKDENEGWTRLGKREAWMFYGTEEGNHSIELRLMDSRKEIASDSVDIQFQRVDWYETLPVWPVLLVVIFITVICGFDRLFENR